MTSNSAVSNNSGPTSTPAMTSTARLDGPVNTLRTVAVFCGAQQGHDPIYLETAIEMANELADRGLDLVYGGGSVGLMGAVARTMLARGRHVTGVIPRALTTRELSGDALGELVVVDTMAERKERMLLLSDAFIVLPGGLGTMDELFEALTWGQLGIQSKPVGLLDVKGYWDSIIEWVDHAVAEGFIRPQHRRLLLAAHSAANLLDAMQSHELPAGLVSWNREDEDRWLLTAPANALGQPATAESRESLTDE